MQVQRVVVRGEGPDDSIRLAGEILVHRLRERQVRTLDGPIEKDAAFVVLLAISPAVGKESFRIENAGRRGVRIVGGDRLGLVHGIGKFLRTCRYGKDGWSVSSWRGAESPQKPLRGIYLATHFNNWYCEAPLADIRRYLDDLALWGYNAIVVAFDAHHYSGLGDPLAVSMLGRLKDILGYAGALGMRKGIIDSANAGYSSTPKSLRAKYPGISIFGCEVCVGTEPGVRLVLDHFTGLFDALSAVQPDLLCLFPYDKGGCGCESCRPWGANGMLKIGEKIAEKFLARFPGGEVVYATWLFDYRKNKGEWRGLTKAFTLPPPWVHYIMADSHGEFPAYPLTQGVPGGLPLLNFPEISMYGMYPWGGAGANPLPRRFQTLWGQVKDRVAGGYPYSEGIFEDLNKALYGQFYWRGDTEVRETIREYLGYECGCGARAAMMRVLDILERNHAPNLIGPMARIKAHGGRVDPDEFISVRNRPGLFIQKHAQNAGAAEAWAIVSGVEQDLPEWGRTAWRWRLIRNRVLIDKELIENQSVISPACEEAFQELYRLYHAARAAESQDGYRVTPLTEEALRVQQRTAAALEKTKSSSVPAPGSTTPDDKQMVW